jgi:amino acid transporter
MGPGAAVFFTVVGFLIMNFVCIPSIQAGSRTVWAFARDEMLPASYVWYRIWKRTDTPVLAVWLYSVLCILVNLIGLGSYITIAAVFNICPIALNWSYCIPIICKLLYGRFERGPWHLGPASVFVNVWACVWNTFMSVIFLFPTVRPVAPDNVRFHPLPLPLFFFGGGGGFYSLTFFFLFWKEYDKAISRMERPNRETS